MKLSVWLVAITVLSGFGCRGPAMFEFGAAIEFDALRVSLRSQTNCGSIGFGPVELEKLGDPKSSPSQVELRVRFFCEGGTSPNGTFGAMLDLRPYRQQLSDLLGNSSERRVRVRVLDASGTLAPQTLEYRVPLDCSIEPPRFAPDVPVVPPRPQTSLGPDSDLDCGFAFTFDECHSRVVPILDCLREAFESEEVFIRRRASAQNSLALCQYEAFPGVVSKTCRALVDGDDPNFDVLNYSERVETFPSKLSVFPTWNEGSFGGAGGTLP